MEQKTETKMPDVKHFRTLFISDVHLGSKGCQADLLLDFLRHHSADKVYLVGDIVDGWRLKKNWYWPQKHNDVVQKFLGLARKGAQVFYLPGNHDEFLRDYLGTHFGGVTVVDRVVHETADGRRLLVIHGDQFDIVVRHAKWLATLGDRAYVFTIKMNTHVNKLRRAFGLSYWSLSAWAKSKVKGAVNFVGEFEKALCHEAERTKVDGVVCGHIHHATMHHDYGIEYINTGDWVESCTLVAENDDGTMEIIRWTELKNAVSPISSDADQEMKKRKRIAA